MVWIDGGAFLFGSSDNSFYGPDYFMRKDIVLVDMNYRLGVLGKIVSLNNFFIYNV